MSRSRKRLFLGSAVITVSAALAAACGSFRGSDADDTSSTDATDGAPTKADAPASDGAFPVNPVDGGVASEASAQDSSVPPNAPQPASTCLSSGGPGNVTITVDPASLSVGQGFTVNVFHQFAPTDSITAAPATLSICTPSGAITELANQVEDINGPSSSATWQFTSEGGIPTSGITQLQFLSMGSNVSDSTQSGDVEITISP